MFGHALKLINDRYKSVHDISQGVISIVMKSVYISISGTNFSSRFVIREMSLYFPHNHSWRHYFFDCPPDIWINDKDRKTDWYTRRVLGGIGIRTRLPGSLQHGQHKIILSKLWSDHKIYCAGHITARFLQELLPYADIEDKQESSPFYYPKELPTANCGTDHRARYCSLAKLRYFLGQ